MKNHWVRFQFMKIVALSLELTMGPYVTGRYDLFIRYEFSFGGYFMPKTKISTKNQHLTVKSIKFN